MENSYVILECEYKVIKKWKVIDFFIDSFWLGNSKH